MRRHYVPNRGINLDYLMWLFTRISGLGVILLCVIGLASAMYMGARLQVDLPTVLRWTFSPILTMWSIAISRMLSLGGPMPSGRSCNS